MSFWGYINVENSNLIMNLIRKFSVLYLFTFIFTWVYFCFYDNCDILLKRFEILVLHSKTSCGKFGENTNKTK